jgi:hypothetical protein
MWVKFIATINILSEQNFNKFSKWKKHVNSSRQNIYIAIDLLQKEQSLAFIARIRDGIGAPAAKRRKNNVISDEYLIKLWKRYDKGRIDIPTFLKSARMRYFQSSSKS